MRTSWAQPVCNAHGSLADAISGNLDWIFEYSFSLFLLLDHKFFLLSVHLAYCNSMTMEVDGHPNSETGPSDKEPGPSPASPWVSTPTDGQNNITTYEPSAESERKSVRTYAGRVESFKLNRWNAKLTKSQTTNPQKMAEIGWFCTGTKDAKCFACFKDLEGWEPKDSPKEEHGKHCPKCPLTVLNISPTSALTFRQMLRLDAAIEYYRKKLITAKQWNKLKDQHEEELNLLVRAIAKIRKENTALLDSDEAEL